MENTEENIEQIWKIQKKIVKSYGKYGRNSEQIWKIQKKIMK